MVKYYDFYQHCQYYTKFERKGISLEVLIYQLFELDFQCDVDPELLIGYAVQGICGRNLHLRQYVLKELNLVCSFCADAQGTDRRASKIANIRNAIECVCLNNKQLAKKLIQSLQYLVNVAALSLECITNQASSIKLQGTKSQPP